MTSTEQFGSPVRVERHDPELVATVAKAKGVDPEEVREVSRLEGLKINEATALKELKAAQKALTAALAKQLDALDAFVRIVKARKEEEANGEV